MHDPLPPGQQKIAPRQWPTMGERAPRDDDSPWTVHVGGVVRNPCSFILGALQSVEHQQRVVDVHCVTRWSKPQVRFGGVPLARLIERAEPAAEARFVSFVARSQRGHSTSLVLDEALDLDVLVALELEGAPLPVERGGPVRVVVPGRYFYKSLKWLERIELLAEDRLGYWESTAGYHNTADPARQQRYMASGLSATDARRILATRDISGRDLLSLQAQKHMLAGLNARSALLRNADFRGCDLQDARFDGANLSNAHFEGADLRRASFRGADLEGADFTATDLRGACLLAESLVGASFCETASAADSPRGPARIDRHTEIDSEALSDLAPEQRSFLRAFSNAD